MISIIDYGRGNLYSIQQALKYLNAESIITNKPAEIIASDRIILPGVGAFGAAMQDLADKDLISPLLEAVTIGKPLLGICLGMQILGDRGEEFGDHKGLGLIPGVVKRLPKGSREETAMRIPNTGWRLTKRNLNDPEMAQSPESNWLYYVHSYSFAVEDASYLTATIDFNGSQIAAAVRRNNILGYQFHPEKSGAEGLEYLNKFLSVNSTVTRED